MHHTPTFQQHRCLVVTNISQWTFFTLTYQADVKGSENLEVGLVLVSLYC